MKMLSADAVVVGNEYLLAIIFSYLGAWDLFFAGHVNKRWRRVSCAAGLWPALAPEGMDVDKGPLSFATLKTVWMRLCSVCNRRALSGAAGLSVCPVCLLDLGATLRTEQVVIELGLRAESARRVLCEQELRKNGMRLWSPSELVHRRAATLDCFVQELAWEFIGDDGEGLLSLYRARDVRVSLPSKYRDAFRDVRNVIMRYPDARREYASICSFMLPDYVAGRELGGVGVDAFEVLKFRATLSLFTDYCNAGKRM